MVDVVIEVLDARIPEASCNPMIEDLRRHRQRPCLKVPEQGRPCRPGRDGGLAGPLQSPARCQGRGAVVQEAR